MRLLLAGTLPVLLALPLAAQRAGRVAANSPEGLAQAGSTLNRDDAEEIEKLLEKNPRDLEARAKMLGYYYYQWMPIGEEAARAARAKHIHYLIQNFPDSAALGLYEAAIDPKGHQLADPAAYEKAHQLWTAQLTAKASNPRVWGNAAKFFQLNDKELAEKALLKAMELEPGNGEWEWRLGYLYALGILGVDGLAFNGQPTSIDPMAKEGPFALKAKQTLETTRSAMVLAVAGNTLYRYGSILAPTAKGRLEHILDAERLFRRAQTIEPGNPTWAQLLQQLQGMKTQMTAPGQ